MRLILLAPAVALASVALTASPAAAAAPDHVGPFTETGTAVVDCGDFDATITGTVTRKATLFYDSDGTLVRVQEFVSAPRDVWENTDTGATIVVRGQFTQTYNRVDDSDVFDVTITGFRYLVNEPGTGVTTQEVGRIVYRDFTEQDVVSMAGQHDLYDGRTVEPTFCDAIR